MKHNIINFTGIDPCLVSIKTFGVDVVINAHHFPVCHRTASGVHAPAPIRNNGPSCVYLISI